MEKKEVVCGYCCCHCADTRCHGNKEECVEEHEKGIAYCHLMEQ